VNIDPNKVPAVAPPVEAIDLTKTETVLPPEEAPASSYSVSESRERTRSGVQLAKWVLVMISVFVLLSIFWIWSSELMASYRIDELIKPGGSSPTSKDLIDPLLKQSADLRDFWIKLVQMVLLNVLLPVLTALLGYVFGSSPSRSQDDASSS